MITLARRVPRSVFWVILVAVVFTFVVPSFVPHKALADYQQPKTKFSYAFATAHFPTSIQKPKPVSAPAEVAAKVAKKAPKKAAAVITATAASQAVSGRVLTVTATAYSSTVDQTDSNPFITASGSHVHWGTVALNGYPFGTKVRFPDMFGDQVFTVEDRTAKKYTGRADIWFPSREAALQFGRRTLRMEIL